MGQILGLFGTHTIKGHLGGSSLDLDEWISILDWWSSLATIPRNNHLQLVFAEALLPSQVAFLKGSRTGLVLVCSCMLASFCLGKTLMPRKTLSVKNNPNTAATSSTLPQKRLSSLTFILWISQEVGGSHDVPLTTVEDWEGFPTSCLSTFVSISGEAPFLLLESFAKGHAAP